MHDEQGNPRKQAPGDRLRVHEIPEPHVMAVRSARSDERYYRDIEGEESDFWLRRRDGAETTTSMLVVEEGPLVVECV